MKAREVESELSKKLLDETTTAELEKINLAMINEIKETAVDEVFNMIKSIPSGRSAVTQFKEFLLTKKHLFKEIEKQQHGKTWDNAIESHEQRGRVKSRSICDFDEYWGNNFD
jgi:hypothetical protein